MNFTGVRLIDPGNPLVSSIVETHKYEWGLNDPSQLRVEPALMYDAVQLFARAFSRLRYTIKANVKALPCNSGVSWEHGFSLNNFMRVVSLTVPIVLKIEKNFYFLGRIRKRFSSIKIFRSSTTKDQRLRPMRNSRIKLLLRVISFQTEMEGLTGLIKFDTAGFRSDFQLDVVRVTEDGLKKIGMWNSTSNVEWLLEAHVSSSVAELTLQNKTFIILIAIVRENTKLHLRI